MWTRTAISSFLSSLALLFAASAPAQRTDTAFEGSGRTCSEITWQASVLARFPNIARACQGVQEYDGRSYVRFDGTVRSVSASGDRVTIQFEGADQAVDLQVPPDARLYIEGRSTRVRDLNRGQELTFHVPASRFVAHFFEPNSQTQFAEARIEPASTAAAAQVAQAQPTSERRLPQTASALPLIGLLGAASLTLGALLLGVVRARRR